MSFKQYRGPVETVEQAMKAHMVVTVTCQRCSHWIGMWAWRIYNASPGARHLPLGKAVSGFRCRGCRRSVQVVILPGMR